VQSVAWVAERNARYSFKKTTARPTPSTRRAAAVESAGGADAHERTQAVRRHRRPLRRDRDGGGGAGQERAVGRGL